MATSASPYYSLIGECCIFGFELHAAAFVELQLEVRVISAMGTTLLQSDADSRLAQMASL